MLWRLQPDKINFSRRRALLVLLLLLLIQKTSEVLSLLRPIVHDTSKTAKNHLVCSSTALIKAYYYYKGLLLGHGCNRSITSVAQWSIRINQVIFAVLDVSWTMGLNSDKTSAVFCINICCFSTRFYIYFVPQWHSHLSFIKIVDVFWSVHPIKLERSLCG